MTSSQELAQAIISVSQKTSSKKSSMYLGYVVAIHSDESDELYGTVDVQEYTDDTAGEVGTTQGFHEGVFLSSIQDVSHGLLFVPKLYSDVIVMRDPNSGEEYVAMFSQAESIRLEGGTTVGIGVVEREQFDVDGGVDVEDLEATGNAAWTTYEKSKVVTTVKTEDGNDSTIEVTTDAITLQTTDGSDVTSFAMRKDGFDLNVGDDITIKSDKQKITVVSGKSEVSIDGSKVIVNAGNVEITGGNVKIKGVANTDMQGPFCAIPTCPFSGAPHTGSMVSGT